MNRALIAGLSGVALILTPALAYAQGTGPDTVACQEASVRVERAATDAVDASDLLVDAQQTIKARLHAEVVAARAELLRAQAALLAGVNLDRAGFAVLTRAVADAEAALTLALSVVLDDAVPSDLTSNLVELRDALQVEIDARVAACADDADAPPTAPAAPPAGDADVDFVDLNPCEIGSNPSAVFIAGLEDLTPAAAQAEVNKLGENGIILLDEDRSTPTVDIDANIEAFIVVAVDRFVAQRCTVDETPIRDDVSDNASNEDEDFTQLGGRAPRGGVATGG